MQPSLLLTVYKPTEPWNKKIVGQKLPLKLQQIWAIRIRLELVKNIRDLALFNLAIESKLRACQLLLGHRKLESTVRYLGIEVDDALEISESIDS